MIPESTKGPRAPENIGKALKITKNAMGRDKQNCWRLSTQCLPLPYPRPQSRLNVSPQSRIIWV